MTSPRCVAPKSCATSGFWLRVHELIFEMGAEGFVFGHQVVEGGVRSLIEARDGEVLFEAADDIASLVGERVQLFGGEVESFVMAETDEVEDAENRDYSDGQNRGVSSLLRGTAGKRSDDGAKPENHRGEDENAAGDQEHFARGEQFSLNGVTHAAGNEHRHANRADETSYFFAIPFHTASSSMNCEPRAMELSAAPAHRINRAHGQENEQHHKAEIINRGRRYQ